MPTYKVSLEWDGCRAYETRIVEAESIEAIEQNPQLALNSAVYDTEYEYGHASLIILQIEEVVQ